MTENWRPSIADEKGVGIYQWSEEYLAGCWEILKSYPSFFAGETKAPDGHHSFLSWWHTHVKDALVGVDEKGVAGAAIMDALYPGRYATIHIFKRKEGLKGLWRYRKLLRHGMAYWMSRYDLQKLVAVVPVTHRAAMAALKGVGFTVTGRFQRHGMIDGVWVDYVWAEMLYSEVV